MQIGDNQCDPPPHRQNEDRVNNQEAYFSSKMSPETHACELFFGMHENVSKRAAMFGWNPRADRLQVAFVLSGAAGEFAPI